VGWSMYLGDDMAAELDRRVATAAEVSRAPGIAWGVVAGGRVVHGGAVGTVDARTPDHGPLPTTSTRFRIASMTKSFTAAAVLLLRDDGALRLDDEVAAYVPEAASLRPPTADSPPVTVRHLLTMASGLATDDAWLDRHLDAPAPELRAWLAAGPVFASAPGTRWEYSNLGYATLGQVVEATAGRRLQEVVHERLLQPLGLRDTVWEPPAERVAVGHRRIDDGWGEEPPLDDGAVGPMGGLWSTVDDLARWVGFWCDAFPPRDDPDGAPLRRASRREAQQAHRAFPSQLDEAAGDRPRRLVAGGYGMGLRVHHDLRFGHLVQHSGGLPGWGSNMRWLPERGVGAVALANVTYAPMGELTQTLLEVLDEGGVLPPDHPVPDDVVAPAGEALAALLLAWNHEAAGALLADNVAMDLSLDRRAAEAHALVASLGPGPRLDRITATTRTAGRIDLAGDAGRRVLRFELTPEPASRIQLYEVVPDP
jgi:serine-type D-Ala-D-Ala carboxypeptidase/endopeptidase